MMMAAAVRRGCIELVMVLGLRRGALPGGTGGADGCSRLPGCLSGLGQESHMAGDDGSRSQRGDGVVCAGGGVELPFSLPEMLTAVGLLDSNGRPQAALAAALGDGKGEGGGAKTGAGRWAGLPCTARIGQERNDRERIKRCFRGACALIGYPTVPRSPSHLPLQTHITQAGGQGPAAAAVRAASACRGPGG